MLPGTLTMPRTASFTAAAVSCTRPPAATMRPAMSMLAFADGTATAMNPSPLRSSVIRSPEPSPTRPSGTAIVPASLTDAPSSATDAPLPALI